MTVIALEVERAKLADAIHAQIGCEQEEFEISLNHYLQTGDSGSILRACIEEYYSSIEHLLNRQRTN